jgi:hypothetical protein
MDLKNSTHTVLLITFSSLYRTALIFLIIHTSSENAYFENFNKYTIFIVSKLSKDIIF